MVKTLLCAIRAATLVVVLVTMYTGRCIAQNPFKYSEHYTVDQGLPSDKLSCITQDDDGFWWIGSNNGLARYDGAYFKTYRHIDGDANSILDNRIRSLCIDGSYLWIGTHLGLTKLNLLTGKFQHYLWTYQCESVTMYQDSQEPVQRIHKDRAGNIWIGTQHCGFAKYFPEQDTFYLIAPDTSLMPVFDRGPMSKPNKIRAFNTLAFIDDHKNDSILWVGSVTALIRYNKITESSEYITQLYDDPILKSQARAFKDLYQDRSGLLYTDIHENRISTYDPDTGEFGSTVKVDVADAEIMRYSIIGFMEVSDSTMWMSTRGGLIEYDFVHRVYLRRWGHDVLNHKYFGAQYIDRDGRILFGSNHGLYVYDPIQQQFELSSFEEGHPDYEGFVYSVTEDIERGRYYACARNADGLYYLDLSTREWNRVVVPNEFFTSEGISLNDIVLTENGSYIIGGTNNIFSYDPDSHVITKVPLDLPLTFNKLQDVFVDSKNVLWINTREDGVFAWNMQSKELHNYKSSTTINTTAASDSESFLEDSHGNIWIKRRNGYSVFNPVTEEIRHYFPENIHGSYNGGMAEDGFGNVWIASVSGWVGAVSLDSIEKGIYHRITVKGASKGNNLIAMAEGPNGYLWCAMREGLVKINPQTEVQEIFNYRYGANPIEMFSFQFMEDGTMVFGKRNSIVFANPNSLKKNQQLPLPYITEVNIGSAPYQSDTVHHKLTVLNLRPEQNFFSIRFSTIGMSFGKDNSIQYRLVGFQDNWIHAGDQSLASYTNVPSGKYMFELRAANNEGYQNPDIFKLPVSIGTPWYAESITRFLFGFLILGLIYAAYRYRIIQIRKEERMQTEFQRKLADVEMSALRAQMNPHFIFNCLNSIENFVIRNDTLKASTYLNDFARLIRLILQNSRSEYVTLEDEIEGLELYLQMESLRFTNKFDYELHIADNVSTTTISIPPMLIQPYVENAIWHGLMHKKAAGSLHIYLSKDENILKCAIVDDGIGRKRSMEINERRSIKRKKSVGMSITADRIKILNELYSMNTEIKITDLYSDQGEARGTKVEISIPI